MPAARKAGEHRLISPNEMIFPEVRHAYLAILYKNPVQALRLLGRLDRPGTHFFIHIDRHSDARPFWKALAGFKEKICYVERAQTPWGGVGFVRAALSGFKAIVSSKIEFDYIHLISGHDYPLQSNASIDAFFRARNGQSFMCCNPMPVDGMPLGAMDRIVRYHLFARKRYAPRWQNVLLRVEGGTNALLRRVGWRRRFPAYVKPHLGSSWCSLTPSVVRYLLDFVRRHPDYLRFHRYTMAADEIVLQSILGSSEDPLIRENLVNDNLRYIDWSKPNQTSYPAVLRTEDFPALMRSGKLWARKFDSEIDEEILQLLDTAAGE